METKKLSACIQALESGRRLHICVHAPSGILEQPVFALDFRHKCTIYPFVTKSSAPPKDTPFSSITKGAQTHLALGTENRFEGIVLLTCRKSLTPLFLRGKPFISLTLATCVRMGNQRKNDCKKPFGTQMRIKCDQRRFYSNAKRTMTQHFYLLPNRWKVSSFPPQKC